MSLDLQVVFYPYCFKEVSLVHEFRGVADDGTVDQKVAQRREPDCHWTLVECVHHHAIVFEMVGRAHVLQLHTAGRDDAEHQEHEKFGHLEILFHDSKRHQKPHRNRCHQLVTSSDCPVSSPPAFYTPRMSGGFELVGVVRIQSHCL